MNKKIIEYAEKISCEIQNMSFDEKIDTLNKVRKILHNQSPFKNEPIDYIEWVKSDNVIANNYNPNNVCTIEMELLKLSILKDGYTQPIVSYKTDDNYEIVDGFHRNRVGKEVSEISNKLHDYLPLTIIRDSVSTKEERIASTIRHNRARGKHDVSKMTDIVLHLKRRNWSDSRIQKELGMDQDEVLRLTQIAGITEMFSDMTFSQAWEIDE